jgi:hypothetical protein
MALVISGGPEARVGTSYQTLLLIGEPAGLRPALASRGVDAWLVPVGPGRVGVLPREGEHDYADVEGLGQKLGAELGVDGVTNEVFDSDVLMMRMYRRGRLTHEYVSDVAMLPDGPSGERGPRGAEQAIFAPFGVGPVDQVRLQRPAHTSGRHAVRQCQTAWVDSRHAARGAEAGRRHGRGWPPDAARR